VVGVKRERALWGTSAYVVRQERKRGRKGFLVSKEERDGEEVKGLYSLQGKSTERTVERKTQ